MNNKDKILVVEDEKDIADLIHVHLSELAVQVDVCGNGEQALQLALANDYQLVMLDIMLPGLSGLDICRQLRTAKPMQAILMLTSRTSEMDRVLGLELGADDYMTKPFSVRELQARVRAQLRRLHCIEQSNHVRVQSETLPANTASLNGLNGVNAANAANGVNRGNGVNGSNGIKPANAINGATDRINHNATCIGQLMIDHVYHQVRYKDDTIDLTSTEFELLSYLSSHPDQVFSRSQLLDSVWGYHHSGYEHTVNSHINRLRSKLEENTAKPQIIQTVWGVGYKLNSAGVH
ncbi:response regulator transcription factor [Litorilituus sediminis]|uniref:response regulator transcription factor n=1 Tax=Litorilituus sediminis TaxID=718192 RepID=UPI001FE3A78F|nr:response regulator transcription factor [Litorilituus sediminis]